MLEFTVLITFSVFFSLSLMSWWDVTRKIVFLCILMAICFAFMIISTPLMRPVSFYGIPCTEGRRRTGVTRSHPSGVTFSCCNSPCERICGLKPICQLYNQFALADFLCKIFYVIIIEIIRSTNHENYF